MALTDYSKTTWVDRNVQYPNRYTDELSNVKTFTPSPGTITQEGTAVNATNLNKIETAVDTLTDEAIRVEKVTQAITTTGSANAYVVTNTNAYASYVSGMIINIKANFSNTGSATINVDGLGAKTIKKQLEAGATALVQGDIISGEAYILVYDGTDMLLTNANPIFGSLLTNTGDVLYASAARTPNRLAIGSTGKALVVEGGLPVWGYSSNSYYVASDTVKFTANTERYVNNSTSYSYVKRFTLNHDGTFKIKGEYKVVGGNTAYLRIYNETTDAVIGTEITTANSTYTAFSITCSTVNAGDWIDLQLKTASGGSLYTYVRNVTLCTTETAYISEIVQN